MCNTQKMSRSSVLEQAINLIISSKNPDTPPDTRNKSLNLALKTFNELCMNATLTPENRLAALEAYILHVPDMGLDMLARWRDGLPFIRGNTLNNYLKSLTLVISSDRIPSIERLLTAVCFYNHGLIEGNKNFVTLARSECVEFVHRVDACKYLFATGDLDFYYTSEEILHTLIDDLRVSSMDRYNVIAAFNNNKGISTFTNALKLRVPFDEEFCFKLQKIFFFNTENEPRYRLLSGQKLLQIRITPPEMKTSVCENILSIASDESQLENLRADACDILIRIGVGDYRVKSRSVLSALGFNTADTKTRISEKARILYNNSQNIHEFTDQINEYILKLVVDDPPENIQPFEEVREIIGNLVREKIANEDDRFEAIKALHRISIDTAVFCNEKITLSEIFVCIYAKIQTFDASVQNELMKRLVQELVEMGDTCSSGHSGRFVNIFSGFDLDLKIEFAEQIHSNYIGRLNARIRDCPDEELRAKLDMAQNIELAEPEDTLALAEFTRVNKIIIHSELYDEFVNGGYISAEKFEEAWKGF